MSTDNEFKQVSHQKDLANLLESIRLRVTSMVGQTADGQHLIFQIRNVTGDIIETTVTTEAARPLRSGEPIELIFGSTEGSFLVRTSVRLGATKEAKFPLGKEVFRLQRRNNFRAPVPATVKVTYLLKQFNQAASSVRSALTVVDLSAGGVRLHWPSAALERPKEGDSMSGVLTLPSEKELELTGVVKTVIPRDGGGFFIGVEFQNASLRDEQSLLFACVQLQREYAYAS